jgi:hypothetical protein
LTKYVAKKILDRVYRESMAELGVGDLAKRRDEAWAMSVLVDAFDEAIPAGSADDGAVSKEILTDLLQRGIDSGKLVESDRDLLLDLAHAAEQIDARGRRGRGGLMTPSVTQTGGGRPRDVFPLDSSSRSRRHQGDSGGG